MKNHTIIRVGKTHHDGLAPDMLVVIKNEDIRESSGAGKKNVTFRNPLGGGWSMGERVDPEEL